MDWHDKLQQFLDSNPELPQGVETKLPAEQNKPALPLLRIEIDHKRAGKIATIVSGFEDESTARQIVAMLKSRLATGGSARGNEILIQGDKCHAVRELLTAQGYKITG